MSFLFSCLSRRRWHSGILPWYLELPWGAYRLNSGQGGGQTQDLTLWNFLPLEALTAEQLLEFKHFISPLFLTP